MRHTQYRNESGSTLTTLFVGFFAGVAAIVLSKRENRERLQNKVNNFLEMGEERMGQVSDAITDMKDQGHKRLSEEVGRVQEKLEDAADTVRSKAKSGR